MSVRGETQCPSAGTFLVPPRGFSVAVYGESGASVVTGACSRNSVSRKAVVSLQSAHRRSVTSSEDQAPTGRGAKIGQDPCSEHERNYEGYTSHDQSCNERRGKAPNSTPPLNDARGD